MQCTLLVPDLCKCVSVAGPCTCAKCYQTRYQLISRLILRTLNLHHIDTVRNVHAGLQSMLFFDDNVIKMIIGRFLLSSWYK